MVDNSNTFTIDTERFHRLTDAINEIILGKEQVILLALTCLIAKGHLLIEDTPGVGKTTLAYTLAKILGLDYQRIQFTSDLLPADIIGTSIYNQHSSTFDFHQGPIFTNFILADEINRATPRTQSALLEAMAEQQITTEGTTRDLPNPFFVIATQNPVDQISTFPLPESQLDRFFMCLELGYPDHQAERQLLQGKDRKELLAAIPKVFSAAELIALQQQLKFINVSESLLDYLQALLEFSRTANDYHQGLSPRAGLAILQAAKAWALIHGQQYVVPEDIQAVLPSVTAHRLKFINDNTPILKPAAHLIQQVSIP